MRVDHNGRGAGSHWLSSLTYLQIEIPNGAADLAAMLAGELKARARRDGHVVLPLDGSPCCHTCETIRQEATLPSQGSLWVSSWGKTGHNQVTPAMAVPWHRCCGY